MKTLAILPALILGAALLGAQPAQSQRGLDATARDMEAAANRVLQLMVNQAHHQEGGDREREENELRAIMFAGAYAGQARAFRLLVERRDDANTRWAAGQLRRAMGTAEEAILKGHVTRDVRAAWEDVRRLGERVDRQLGGGREQ
jgi:hypothetical protein